MVGIIKKLFSGKDNYYIELDENEDQNSSQEETAQKTEEKAEPPQATQKTKNADQVQNQQSSPEPTATTQQQPVSVQSNGSEKANQLAGETFAPNYLMPKATNSRRRPGANMSEFMELARDMKAPRNQ
ncbi:MAG: hypothetical protein ACLFQP_08715 [Halothece sp.]